MPEVVASRKRQIACSRFHPLNSDGSGGVERQCGHFRQHRVQRDIFVGLQRVAGAARAAVELYRLRHSSSPSAAARGSRRNGGIGDAGSSVCVISGHATSCRGTWFGFRERLSDGQPAFSSEWASRAARFVRIPAFRRARSISAPESSRGLREIVRW
jgi:hypothetical protein